MLNFKKICPMLLLATFVCMLPSFVQAYEYGVSESTAMVNKYKRDVQLAQQDIAKHCKADKKKESNKCQKAKQALETAQNKQYEWQGKLETAKQEEKKAAAPSAAKGEQNTVPQYLNPTAGEHSETVIPGSSFIKRTTAIAHDGDKQQEEKPSGIGGGDVRPDSEITGCSADYGLFSGLIKTGKDIFNGLRDLIYVVAGFGIIGVAVGGFFGNLNWKWLGAIIIALVVIATTGEIINMITGCENFTKAMITNTLK